MCGQVEDEQVTESVHRVMQLVWAAEGNKGPISAEWEPSKCGLVKGRARGLWQEHVGVRSAQTGLRSRGEDAEGEKGGGHGGRGTWREG